MYGAKNERLTSLAVESDIALLQKSLINCQGNVRFRSAPLTKTELKTGSPRCQILFINCHGHIGEDDSGIDDSLIVEYPTTAVHDDLGKGQHLTCADIIALKPTMKPTLVVMMTCHGEKSAARAFIELEVPYVIYIERLEELFPSCHSNH